MPFASKKQRRFMHANLPKLAKKWESEAKRQHAPAIRTKRKK